MKAEGLEWLVKHMPKRAKCRHRDAAEDAARLVEGYRQWAAGLFPKLPLGAKGLEFLGSGITPKVNQNTT